MFGLRFMGPVLVRIGLVAGTLTLGLLSHQAVAATATGTFTVSATVQATCSVTAANLAFGVYTGAILTSSSVVQITCTNTTPYTVALNAGTGASATTTIRKMTGPAAATVTYAIYQDSGHTSIWGNTPATDVVSGTGNGVLQSINLYGGIPAGQFVAPGAYTDTITATIAY